MLIENRCVHAKKRLLLLLAMITFACSNTASLAQTQQTAAPTKTTEISGERIAKKMVETVQLDNGYSFQQYQTRDKRNRTITFYLSEPQQKAEELPIVAYVVGSGGGSLFEKDEGKSTIRSGIYDLYLKAIDNKARLLLVEKQGVKLFEKPKVWGSQEGCSDEFLREHTLEGCTEAHNAAIEAAQNLPGISKKHLLVIGHSEGGQISPHIAVTNPKVTHVASLAGAGPTQLFEMAYGAEHDPSNLDPSHYENGKVPTAKERVDAVYRAWDEIKSDPHSITKFWSGHTYNRWYSFCSGSPMEDLSQCKAKIYIAQGTNDWSTPSISFDIAKAVLASKNREFVGERVEGADHGFKIKKADGKSDDQLPALIGRIMKWFFADVESLK